MMKVALVFCTVVTVALGLNCYAGKTAAEAKVEGCAHDGETYCAGPDFKDYRGYSDQAYVCGDCKGRVDCTQCTADLCNAPAPESDTYVFECAEYKWVGDKFVADPKALTQCLVGKATEASCNSPGESAISTTPIMNQGCGPCVDGTVTDKTCVECDGTRCNSESDETIETSTDIEYECDLVKWDTATSTFKAAETKTKCYTEDENKKLCNKAGEEAKAEGDYTALLDGCGPCGDEAKKAKTCADNSAATITAFLFPVIALFCILF